MTTAQTFPPTPSDTTTSGVPPSDARVPDTPFSCTAARSGGRPAESGSEPETSARVIVRLFGGTRAMARAGGWPSSTVQSWKTSGRIPARRQAAVLAAAARLGLALSPADFFQDGVFSQSREHSARGPASALRDHRADYAVDRQAHNPVEKSADKAVDKRAKKCLGARFGGGQ